ncbi:MAG: nucleotide exchange factor GrpE [Verrucomicrobiales bacterium]|nr:nucleotide exchange factor GrpE [Verrucomicrobiales bacterium]
MKKSATESDEIDEQNPEKSDSETGASASEGTEADIQVEMDGDPVAKLEAEVERWKDTAARARADLENFRKRMAREKSDSIQYANSSLLQSLIPVIDNFEMGMKAAKEAEGEDSVIFQGMSMVQKQLSDFLEENHVQPIKAVGESFDPNLHEAVKQESSEIVPEGEVIYELRRGYKLRDRLLRAANVVVSTGPPDSNSRGVAEEG